MRKLSRCVLILLLTCIIAAVGGYFYEKENISPVYTATVKLYVVPGEENEASIRASNGGLNNDFMIIFTSNIVISDAQKTLATTEDIAKYLTVSSPDNSNIIEITCENPDKGTARAYVDAVAKTAVKTTSIIPVKSIQILPADADSDEMIRPHLYENVAKITGVAGIACVILEMFILLIVSAFKKPADHSDDEWEYEKHYGKYANAQTPVLTENKEPLTKKQKAEKKKEAAFFKGVEITNPFADVEDDEKQEDTDEKAETAKTVNSQVQTVEKTVEEKQTTNVKTEPENQQNKEEGDFLAEYEKEYGVPNIQEQEESDNTYGTVVEPDEELMRKVQEDIYKEAYRDVAASLEQEQDFEEEDVLASNEEQNTVTDAVEQEPETGAGSVKIAQEVVEKEETEDSQNTTTEAESAVEEVVSDTVQNELSGMQSQEEQQDTVDTQEQEKVSQDVVEEVQNLDKQTEQLAAEQKQKQAAYEQAVSNYQAEDTTDKKIVILGTIQR